MLAHVEMIYPTATTGAVEVDASEALLTWLLLGLGYHALVVIFWWGGWNDFRSFGPFWCKVAIQNRRSQGKNHNNCRLARYYKCLKRSSRNKKKRCCLMECPFGLSKLHMPPPLPLRRNRKRGAHTSETEGECCSPGDKDEQVPLCDKSSASTESQDSLASSKPTPDKKTRTKKKKTKTKKSAIATPLIDLARMQHWSLVIQKACRKESKQMDADGLLPIHWAVSGGPPLEVVQALLDAYPRSAWMVDGEGSTALHFATHYGASAAVVDLLLTVHPDAVRVQDVYGRSPLYHAVEKSCSVQVLDKLIQADPTMITTPCIPPSDTTSVQDERPHQHRTPLFVAWAKVVRDRTSRLTKKGKLWDKADMLLQAAYANHHDNGHDDIPPKYRMVHASITLEVYLPPQVIDYALELYPQQLLQREEWLGRTPLAVAASQQQLTMSRSRELLNQIWTAEPRAIHMLDHQHHSVLSLAAQAGKLWNAVDQVFAARPQALSQRNGPEHLYPVLWAAVAAATDTNRSKIDRVLLQSATVYSTFERRPLVKHDDAKQLEWKKSRSGACQNDKKTQTTWDEEMNHGMEAASLSTIYHMLRLDPTIVKVPHH